MSLHASFFYLSIRFFSLFLRSWTISCAASSSFCLLRSCFWRSAFISFSCWFLSVPLTFGLDCLRCVGFTISACSVSLELSAENSVKKIDNIEYLYIFQKCQVFWTCVVFWPIALSFIYLFFQLWIMWKSRLNRKAKGTRLLKYSKKMIFCNAPKCFFSRKKSGSYVSLRVISLSVSIGCCFPL